jgi:hypothetical protein
MSTTYNSNDLLLSIFNEIDECATFKIRTEMTQNEALRNEYKELMDALNTLDKHSLSPSTKAIENIMSVASKESKKTTKKQFV